MRSQKWGTRDGISSLIRRVPRELAVSSPCEDTEEGGHLKASKGALTGN